MAMIRSVMTEFLHDDGHYHAPADDHTAVVARIRKQLRWDDRKPEFMCVRPVRGVPDAYGIVLNSGKKQAAGRTGRSDFRALRSERIILRCDICRVVVGQIVSRTWSYVVNNARAATDAQVKNRRRKPVMCMTCLAGCTRRGVCPAGCPAPEALSDERLRCVIDSAGAAGAPPVADAAGDAGASVGAPSVAEFDASWDACVEWDALETAMAGGGTGESSEELGVDAFCWETPR